MGRRRETVQTTSTSSSAASSRRETSGSDHIQKTVGCMTGLFHFFSRHHQNHSRKRLTSANKKEKIVLPPPKSSPEKTPPPSRSIEDAASKKRTDLRRKSCETPRSPAIPQEIRRRSSSSSAESPGRQRGLVARLMGLEDSSPSPDTSTPESAAEKRRKLLGALEKCDEDLQTLRRIIEAVRLAEVKTKAVVSAVESAQRPESGGRKEPKTVEFGGGERPSPVSVFDAISSPRYRSKRHHNGGSEISAVGSKIVKPSRMSVLFSGENCKKLRDGDGDQINERLGTVCRNAPDDDGMPPLPPPPPQRAYELKELIARKLTEGCRQRRWWWQTKRSLSQAMVENVGEVWEDGVWEERWEVGRVAVALAGDVLWDLVEEAVTDLMACCCELSFARRRACRKRLYF